MKKAPSKNREVRDQEKTIRKARRILIGATIFYVIATLAALPPGMAAVRMFDAHGSTENPATILLFLSFFSFPAVLLCSILAAWIFYVLQNYRRVYWILLLPLINIIGAGAGLLWLQVAYDGLFGGKQ